jgi:hypothetical protein
MIRISLLIFFFLYSPSILNAQKTEELEKKVKRLEKMVDSLKNQIKFQMRIHNEIYNHSEIETTLSDLALPLSSIAISPISVTCTKVRRTQWMARATKGHSILADTIQQFHRINLYSQTKQAI